MTDALRALLAASPVLAVLGLIASRRVPAHLASTAGAALGIALAVGVWNLPGRVAALASAYGMATGIFPILYIIFASLLLYQLTVQTGWAERLRAGLSGLVRDRHVLLLLVGFGFASFLDSTAGFLAPVAVSTALLAGLGVPPLEAAAYTLVASAPCALYGGMGTPVLVMSRAAGIAAGDLGRAQAPIALVVMALVPPGLTLAFGGRAELRRVWAPALAAGAAYGGVAFATARWVSFHPAALLASLAAMAAVLAAAPLAAGAVHRGGHLRAAAPCWPYAVLMAAVALWSAPPVARALGRVSWEAAFPALGDGARWRVDLLASPGTAILASAGVVALVARPSAAQAGAALRATTLQLRHTLVTLLGMFALGQVMNASGMTRTLGAAVAGAGALFPLVSPSLAAVGAAITGSNTASNALLGPLQAATAAQLGLDPVRLAAFAAAAAPFGKMIAPQVISAAAAAGGVEGSEPRLLRVGLGGCALGVAALGIAAWVALR